MIEKIFIRLAIIILFYSSVSVIAQDNFEKVAQSGMQYLKIGVDGAMVGKGESGISYVEGVSAMFWNPAGLSDLKGQEVMFSHNSWIADISMNVFAFGMDFNDWGVFGVNLLWMDYGELRRTSVATTIEQSAKGGYVDEGSFSPSDMALGLAYSLQVSEQFSFGGQVRYLYQNYGNNIIINNSGESVDSENTMSAFTFDFGTKYRTGFESLVIAMAIQNFSSDLKYHQESFSTPLTFKIGASMNLFDIYDSGTNNKLILSVDAIHPRDFSERLNLGLEFDYLGLFQLRGGYRINYDEANFTTGAGVKYSLSNNIGIRVDLSYMLVSSNRFTSPLQLTAGLYIF